MIRFFVNRCLFSYVLFILVCLIGIFAFKIVPRQEFPDINMDIMTIQTVYPSASPLDVETNITDLIEKELEGVSGVEELISASMLGVSIIQVKVSQDASKEERRKTKKEIERAVQRVKNLPSGLKGPPIITEKKSSDFPLLEIGVTASTYEKSRKYAQDLRDQIRLISGVGRVELLGDLTREIHIECQKEQLDKYQVSLSEVYETVLSSDKYVSSGQYSYDNKQLSIILNGSLETINQIEDIVIRSRLGDSSQVKIKDIAKVKWGYEPEATQVYINGQRGIVLIVMRKTNEDTIILSQKVKEVCQKSQKNEADYHFLFNSSNDTKQLFKVVLKNGLMGLGIVLIVLFLFLDWRMAIFVALGIPFCILGTVCLFPLLGLSINSITLIGFILVLGMLVDDAIVVAESIKRQKEKGKKGIDSALEGVKNVLAPVSFTVISTMVCFFPMMFMKGILGKFVFSIPVVVIICLLFSLFESSLLLPSHIGHIKKSHKKNKSFIIKYLQKNYMKCLLFSFKYRSCSLILFIVFLVVLSFIAIKGLKFDLFPQQDSNVLLVSFEGNRQWNLDKMRKEVEKYEVLLSENESQKRIIEGIKTQIGVLRESEGRNLGETRPFWGYMTVFLKDYRKRNRKIKKIEEDINQLFKHQESGLTYHIYSAKGGPPVGDDITLNILSKSNEKNEKLAQEITQYLDQRKGVDNVRLNIKPSSDRFVVIPDQKKAHELGISYKNISQTIQMLGEGRVTRSKRIGDERIDIRVKSKTEEIEKALKLSVGNNRGNLIKLEHFCEVKKEMDPGTIHHFSGFRSIEVSANVIEGETTSLEENKLLKEKFIQRAKERGVILEFGGSEKESQKSFESFVYSFITAFLFIYLLLILFFNSLIKPFLILLLIPFGVMSVIIVFSIHGMPMSFLGTIGLLGLIGVMINDAMVMLSALKEIPLSVISSQHIVRRSGERLRPVLLTTVTTVAGLLPTVYGWGGKEILIVPLAMSIGWGLIIVTFVTLFIVPLMFSLPIFSKEGIK